MSVKRRTNAPRMPRSNDTHKENEKGIHHNTARITASPERGDATSTGKRRLHASYPALYRVVRKRARSKLSGY